MKNSSRKVLYLAVVTLALVTSHCDCTRTPYSEGPCQGSVGAMSATGRIDSDASYYFTDETRGVDFLVLSFGEGKGRIEGEVSRAAVTGGSTILHLPGEPPTSEASPEIHSWQVLSPSPRPRLVGGTLKRSIETVDFRLVGETQMDFEDGTSLTCSFTLRIAKDRSGTPDDSEAGCTVGESSDGDSNTP
jgi:hypothetical protein